MHNGDFYAPFAVLVGRLHELRAYHGRVNVGLGHGLVEALQWVLRDCAEARALKEGGEVEDVARVDGFGPLEPSERARRCLGCERVLPLTNAYFAYDGKQHKAGAKFLRARCKSCLSEKKRNKKKRGRSCGLAEMAALAEMELAEDIGSPGVGLVVVEPVVEHNAAPVRCSPERAQC